MKVFNIIPYWIDTKTGETRARENWIFFKMGETYDEVYKWAKANKDKFNFEFTEVFQTKEIEESSLKFDFSVKEEKYMFLTDTEDNEYKIQLKPIAKIQIQRIEVSLEE